MKFEITPEWLERKLVQANDTNAAAGGTDLEQLRKDAEERTVTPTTFAGAPTEIGRVVCYIREERGWSRNDLAELAMIDEAELASIESEPDYELPPRTLINLADACGFSRRRFQELANHVIRDYDRPEDDADVRFAARSGSLDAVSRDEFEAIRALVKVLVENTGEK